MKLPINADKPYPTTRLEIVMPNDIVAQMDMGKRNEHDVHQICRWIRTPFQTKAYEQWHDGTITICELAARYFAHCQSQQTVLAMVDGKSIDPRIPLQECSKRQSPYPEGVSFVGGCKKKKTKMSKRSYGTSLVHVGYPKTWFSQGSMVFMSKVSPDKIRTHAGETWARQWVSLKQLANEAHFRLITTDELRAYQNKKRVEKQNDAEIVSVHQTFNSWVVNFHETTCRGFAEEAQCA